MEWVKGLECVESKKTVKTLRTTGEKKEVQMRNGETRPQRQTNMRSLGEKVAYNWEV